MYASELAQELTLDPSVITKRLAAYRAETGSERTRLLDAKTVGDMREVHRLLQSRTAATTREAVRRVLGEWIEPVSADEAHDLVRRLSALETTVGNVERLVTEMHAIVQSRDRQRSLAVTERVDVALQERERKPEERSAGPATAPGLPGFGGLVGTPPASKP